VEFVFRGDFMNISLVTGASSGLGRNTAILLCEKGHKVYVTARRKDKLKELKKECKIFKGEIIPISGDLTDSKFREKLIKEIFKKEKKLDYFINNAGYGTAIKIEDQNIDDIERMYELNTIAPEHFTKLLMPHFKKQKKARAIYVGSIVAFTPLPYFATYNATKSALFNFVKSIKYELKNTEIITSIVLPSRMKTGFGKTAFRCIDTKERCLEEWNKMAGSSMKVGKTIINSLDSNKFIIIPGIKTKFLYWLGRIFPSIVNLGTWLTLEPKMRKHVESKRFDPKKQKN
jgi:uncharacterized protein